MKICVTIVIALFCFLPRVASSQNVELIEESKTLVVSRRVDVATSRAAISQIKSGRVEVVRIRDCMGGLFGPGKELAEVIRLNRITTEASGHVRSACHLVFMGGSNRRTAARDVYFAVHSPSKNEMLSTPEAVNEFVSLLKHYSDGKFPGEFESAIRTTYGANSATHFTKWQRAKGNRYFTMTCRRADESDTGSVCSKQIEVSFITLGLETPQ